MIDYIFFFIGIVVIVISFLLLKTNNDNQATIESQMIKNRDKELLERVYLIENIIEELKAISEETIQNIDMKTNDIYHMLQTVDKNMEKYTSIVNKKEYSGDIEENARFVVETHLGLMKDGHMLNHDEDTKKILGLVDEGYSPAQIAKKLDKGIGEVQLICNLKKR
ncbi:DUF6115 domain-containing protein [Marinisporobacter balticus]|uniref:Uncharacterized protein n=1 Tax=Marinisporobacter balticus TaxID=2018667 RepID=A0A4R2L3W0_9FIRM|nr:hypothetical protein [Marinisporobacter balticus]TCO79917.1 hypothetical protein EV214_101151 [Marinisporobacter balticus]